MAIKRIILEDAILLKDEDQTVLEIKESVEENTAVLVFSGSLRSDTANEVFDELNALVITGLNLCVNMKDVTYLSPSCSHVLLQIQQILDKRGKGEMVLNAVPAKIYDELKQTGISELLLIEE